MKDWDLMPKWMISTPTGGYCLAKHGNQNLVDEYLTINSTQAATRWFKKCAKYAQQVYEETGEYMYLAIPNPNGYTVDMMDFIKKD